MLSHMECSSTSIEIKEGPNIDTFRCPQGFVHLADNCVFWKASKFDFENAVEECKSNNSQLYLVNDILDAALIEQYLNLTVIPHKMLKY